jgi:hypothetical protein
MDMVMSVRPINNHVPNHMLKLAWFQQQLALLPKQVVTDFDARCGMLMNNPDDRVLGYNKRQIDSIKTYTMHRTKDLAGVTIKEWQDMTLYEQAVLINMFAEDNKRLNDDLARVGTALSGYG